MHLCILQYTLYVYTLLCFTLASHSKHDSCTRYLICHVSKFEANVACDFFFYFLFSIQQLLQNRICTHLSCFSVLQSPLKDLQPGFVRTTEPYSEFQICLSNKEPNMTCNRSEPSPPGLFHCLIRD